MLEKSEHFTETHSPKMNRTPPPFERLHNVKTELQNCRIAIVIIAQLSVHKMDDSSIRCLSGYVKPKKLKSLKMQIYYRSTFWLDYKQAKVINLFLNACWTTIFKSNVRLVSHKIFTFLMIRLVRYLQRWQSVEGRKSSKNPSQSTSLWMRWRTQSVGGSIQSQLSPNCVSINRHQQLTASSINIDFLLKVLLYSDFNSLSTQSK